MIAWLWLQLVPLTLTVALLLLLRPWILRWFGARCQYSLWLAIPVSLAVGLLPKQVLLGEGAIAGDNRLLIVATKLNAGVVGATELIASSSAITTLWLGGLLMMLLVVLRQWREIAAQLLHAQPQRHFGEILYVSPSKHGPLITGWRRPLLLMPLDFKQRFSPLQQQLIIKHELTHWQRGDVHANALAWLLLGLFWFHPLCWLAYRAYRQDQELACDALVLHDANVQQKAAYSYALLTSAQHGAASWYALTNHYGDKAMMKQRLAQLQRQQGFSKLGWVAALAVALGLVLVLQAAATAASKAEPTPQQRVAPKYPVQAATDRIEGYVEAVLDVMPDGSVTNVHIVKSVPAAVFDKVSVRALEQWRYSATAAGYQKVPVRLDFQLDAPAPDAKEDKS